jgi:hypothetical protein
VKSTAASRQSHQKRPHEPCAPFFVMFNANNYVLSVVCLLFAMFSYLIFKYSNTNALIEMSLRVTCPPSRALRRGGRERSNPWPRPGLYGCGDRKASMHKPQKQCHFQITSRLPIPSRSRDGEGRLTENEIASEFRNSETRPFPKGLSSPRDGAGSQ